jgi:DNA-binding transcriptional ArsR family regulator
MTDSLLAVVGSVTRAYSLAVLSGTRQPMTAYRIAKLANLSAPNVYLELRKLAGAGVVERRDGGWVLADERVRAFCEGRGPLFESVLSLEAKRRWARENRRRLSRLRSEPPSGAVAWTGPQPKLMRQFSRSTTKNGLLRAAGLKASKHKRR